MKSCWRIQISPSSSSEPSSSQKFVRPEAVTRVMRWTRGKMTSLWYVLPPVSPSTLIRAPMAIVRILQYLHTYTRSFSPFNRAPVLIVIRVSYVWQTPRAKSPSKRQLEGNHGGSKPLMRDTCHVLKCAGDESGKEVTDFCMDSFFLPFVLFFLSQPSSVELIMGIESGRSGTRWVSGHPSAHSSLRGPDAKQTSASAGWAFLHLHPKL